MRTVDLPFHVDPVLARVPINSAGDVPVRPWHDSLSSSAPYLE